MSAPGNFKQRRMTTATDNPVTGGPTGSDGPRTVTGASRTVNWSPKAKSRHKPLGNRGLHSPRPAGSAGGD